MQANGCDQRSRNCSDHCPCVLPLQVALARGNTMRGGADSGHGPYSPHTSSRTIHDSRHSIAVPGSPNGHLSNGGDDDHTAVCGRRPWI